MGAGFVAAGGATSTAGSTTTAGLGGTMASEAVLDASVTAAAATEPDGARWALSAIRPATIREPTTTKYFRMSIIPPLGPLDRRISLVARAADLVHSVAPWPRSTRPLAGQADVGGGGMVSNHRLVLFTHALCRLSYPAGWGKLPGLAATVCAKLLTSSTAIPHAALVGAMPKAAIARRPGAARSIAFRGGKRFSARRAAKGNER